ncbi:MAG: endopeptidase La [Anaerolineae bacterium]|nr:endopeptidase La [Anaerolineae bacterium]
MPISVVPTGGSSATTPDGKQGESGLDIPEELAILPLRGVVLYPMTALPLTVGQPRSIQLVDEAVLKRQMIGLVATKSEEVEEPGPDDVYRVGTVAVVHRLRKAPDGTILLFVQGMERIRIVEFTQTQPYLKARVEPIPDAVEDSIELEALSRNILDLFRRLVNLVPHIPDEMMMMIMNIEDPRQLAYLIATSLRMNITDAQEVLELDDVRDKLRKLTSILTRELEVLELGKKIQSEAQSEMEKVQREYFLREQLKAIKRELGEEDEQALELEEYRRKIEESGMPEEARKEALRELSRMEKMPTAAAEYSVIKTYLDWMTSLPWNKVTEDNLDIARARQILDEDHYDLEDVKERILEYLAVRRLRQERAEEREAESEHLTDYIRREREGVILCFVGPPGTGKTSLGQSIARALGRKFVRMSLGGIRDEAEIRGFRRTYVGSMPGRIIQALRRAESRNPVFMLDEVDKIGADWRGDPSSALLEVLDPEQNRDFRDHYLDVPFDLSQVMFITTANLLDPIPAPLRDRMEILTLDGYTEEEKIKIAQQYLLPRQIRENGLRQDEVQLTEGAIRRVVREYTREAGVRNLERELGSICRKIATKIAEEGEGAGPTLVTEEDIPQYLGKPKYYPEVAERTEIPGVATGLVVTAVGGDITFIEATKMKGKQGLILTGQLGDVMRESAQAALSYVRSKAHEFGIDENAFIENDIHIHVPAGAVPKDGPSAGVTMATALASLFTGRPVDPHVAMTGEITLRGQVLPVGGIKQKVLAAARAGLRTVILPKRNEADLEDIPPEVREKLNFILADHVDQVIQHALLDGTERRSEQ